MSQDALALYLQLADEHARMRAELAQLEVQMQGVHRTMTPEQCRELGGYTGPQPMFLDGSEDPTVPGAPR